MSARLSIDVRPLPTGWEEKFDERTQRWYYINHQNHKTTWNDPRTPRASTMTMELTPMGSSIAGSTPTPSYSSITATSSQTMSFNVTRSSVGESFSMGRLFELPEQRASDANATPAKEASRDSTAGRRSTSASSERNRPSNVSQAAVSSERSELLGSALSSARSSVDATSKTRPATDGNKAAKGSAENHGGRASTASGKVAVANDTAAASKKSSVAEKGKGKSSTPNWQKRAVVEALQKANPKLDILVIKAAAKIAKYDVDLAKNIIARQGAEGGASGTAAETFFTESYKTGQTPARRTVQFETPVFRSTQPPTSSTPVASAVDMRDISLDHEISPLAFAARPSRNSATPRPSVGTNAQVPPQSTPAVPGSIRTCTGTANCTSPRAGRRTCAVGPDPALRLSKTQPASLAVGPDPLLRRGPDRALVAGPMMRAARATV